MEQIKDYSDLSYFMTSNSFEYNIISKIPETLLKILDGLETIIATDVQDMFAHCIKLKSIPKLNINTVHCQDFGYMFAYNKSLVECNTEWLSMTNATYAAAMYSGCEKLEYLDFSHIDTSNIQKMMWMFNFCENLRKIAGVFDLSSCDNVEGMFGHCLKLEEVKLTNIPETLDISNIGIDESKIKIV